MKYSLFIFKMKFSFSFFFFLLLFLVLIHIMEATIHSNKRRASESEASGTLALISGQQFIRIPPPLPYLPSDYQPSPESPRRNLVLSKRQRSLSTGHYLTIEHVEEPSSSHFELVPYREWTVIS